MRVEMQSQLDKEAHGCVVEEAHLRGGTRGRWVRRTHAGKGDMEGKAWQVAPREMGRGCARATLRSHRWLVVQATSTCNVSLIERNNIVSRLVARKCFVWWKYSRSRRRNSCGKLDCFMKRFSWSTIR